MPGRHGAEDIGDGKRGDPIDIAVRSAINRDPIPALNLSFKMAMPSIVNQEIVIFGQRLAEVIKGLEEIKTRSVEEYFRFEAVFPTQDCGDIAGILFRRVQAWPVGISVVAND